MALQLIEGFDYYNLPTGSSLGLFAQGKGWVAFGSGGGFHEYQSDAGRLSGLNLGCYQGGGALPSVTVAYKNLPAAYGSLYMGAGVYFDSLASFRNLLAFTPANYGPTIAALNVDATGKLFVSNHAGTTIATGASTLVINSWNYLELGIVVGVSGSCTVQLNGVAEIATTTGDFGTTNIGCVGLLSTGISAGITNTLTQYDDVYVCDGGGGAPWNTFLGDCRVETQFPNADGSNLAWTPDTGVAHYSRVNETSPDGDASYVYDNTPGDRDSYHFNTLSGLVGTVYGVQTNIYARKDDAASRTIADVIRMSGVNYDGTTTAGLSTSYLYYWQLHQLDPTGTAWTINSVNTAEFGVKEVS